MPVITRLEPQQNDPERVNVYLDGLFGFGASQLAVASHRLSIGKELSAEDIDVLRTDDAVERAYGSALNLLSFRPRSRGEIEAYFRRKKADPVIVGAVIERLQRAGFLDDSEFARYWVDNRQNFRPKGARALRAELRTKGVAPEVIDHALEEMGDEEGFAYDAGLKKVRSLERLDDKEFLKKMLGFLQRRGFAYGPAIAAAKRLSEARGGAVDFDDLPPGDD